MAHNTFKPLMTLMAIAAAAAVTTVAAPNEASAQGSVLELHTVEGEHGKLVVAVSPNGVTFIKPKDNKVFRAYKSSRKAMKGTKPDWFIIRDVDRDGTIDIVSGGAPAFIVNGSGAPVFNLPKGCDQFHMGDFYAGSKADDILCRDKNKLTVMTYDGQEVWSFNIKGLRLGQCTFEDFTGDLKLDIACSTKGGSDVLALNINSENGELSGVNPDQITDPEDDNPGYAATMANYLKGQETFDLNGDGTAEEMVQLDGSAIVVRSKSKPKAIARHEIGKAFSVLVDDIDGDNDMEIVVGGDGKVLVIDHEGKLVSTIKTDPKKLKRSTDVQITRVDANGLADNSEATNRAAIEKGNKKLAQCYAGNVRKNPFTRVGNTIWGLSVDKKGKVKKVERLHSELADKTVEGCLSKALKGLSFPAATDPGAMLTITLQFGFVDQ